ncbi:paraneoplastic antigen-like protein 5 [Ptychodera flava]|uniref:paraneoplastic antigen-like protein 5 n=1 Tax=Ptychodera flava TaxID=63121 RepID=UPI00396AA8D3
MASRDGASYRWMREGPEPIKEDLGDWRTAIKTPPPLTPAQLAGLDGYDDVKDREPAEYVSLPTPPRNSTPYQPRERPPSRSPPPRQAGPDAAWMDMMEKLVTNLQPRTNESGWYRKLRVFSSRRPVPVNEDDYEIRDYLDALEGSYGTRLTPAESLKAFQSCYQKAEWSHSQYLQELQTLLRRAIRQGSVKEYEADYLRLKQFTDGVLYNESHLSSLQLDTKLNHPPGYVELMQMVRKEEARQEEKAKKRAHEGPTPSASTNYTAICDSF